MNLFNFEFTPMSLSDLLMGDSWFVQIQKRSLEGNETDGGLPWVFLVLNLTPLLLMLMCCSCCCYGWCGPCKAAQKLFDCLLGLMHWLSGVKHLKKFESVFYEAATWCLSKATVGVLFVWKHLCSINP